MSENQENLQPDAGVVLPDDSGENFTTGTGLPENAFRELGADEQYVPVMNPAHDQKEVTPYSVITGLVMAIIFSAAAAYLGLKVGQVFEAAIPIAIIAVGLSNMLGKKNAMGQNVIIQSIGACSGVIVAGAIFTLPALYILQGTYPDIMVHFYQIFLSSLLGGILGILFFIPFRRYFVKDMHGKYPFPEATATTQVLVSSEAAAAKGDNSQARTLILASLIGGIYDYIVATFGWWAETITSTASAWGTAIAEKTKLVFSCNTGAALLGLGYIVGLKYAFVIFAGSAFIWWVVVPLMGTYGSPEIASQAPEWIFSEYARKIGIGGIAMAGLIGIIKSWGIIVAAVGLAGKELKGNAGAVKNVRWQTDLSMKKIVVPVFQFRHKPLRHDAAFMQKLCHSFTGFVSGIVVIKAEIDNLRLRFQHLHHRNWGRAAAGNVAVLLPLMWIHRDIREHIDGSFEHIKAPVRAGMMKTVTRVAGLDVQAKGFAEAVRAAQMRVARASTFVRADEHGVVMRRVLVEHFLPGEI